MIEIRKYYIRLHASLQNYHIPKAVKANYWKLHFELSHWQRSHSNRNVKCPFLCGASCMGVSLYKTYSRLQQVGMRPIASKTSLDQHYFLLHSLFIKRFLACSSILSFILQTEPPSRKHWHAFPFFYFI